jgi:type 2A phosphatase activator TIP41
MHPSSQNYQFKDWSIQTAKTRILASQGEMREKYEKDIKLPHLPDMLFANNYLKLNHKNGFGIEFNAYDSLLLVDPKADLIKVSVAKEWQESRADCEFIDKMVHPFDWTFTTPYKGSLVSNDKSMALKASPTEEKINIEKLKIPENILFFDEVTLFGDELSDHGDAFLTVKIRVMPTSFFILQRFFLRVDNVVIRIYDTRIYHEIHKSYIIREYIERESLVKDLKCSPRLFTEPNEIVNYLEVKSSLLERLDFPETHRNKDIAV